MSQNNVPGWVKPALELGPVLAFFVAYMWLKDDMITLFGAQYSGFVIVTALFIPLIWIATLLFWVIFRELSKMQIMTAILVTVFGGLTVWLNDEQFIKMKPTLIYLIFGGILGLGLLRGKSFVQSLMGDMLPLKPEGWMMFTKRLTALFFGLAVLNEVIWRYFSTDAWVYFKTFGIPIAMIVFLASQVMMLQAYLDEEKETPKS